MGIDYVLVRDCAPRTALGSTGIIDLGKARERADLVLATVRAEGDDRPLAQITFDVSLRTPAGDTVQTVRVQDLMEQAEPLEDLRHHCETCPVDVGGKGFGCTRYIAYPIPAAAEHWLMARLPEDLDSTAGQFLLQALEDFGWDGAPVAAMRAQGNTFFEDDEPATIRWGDDDDAVTLSSDQVLQMMFHVGHLEPTHAMMLCLFFGILPHDVDVEVLNDPMLRTQALASARIRPTPAMEVGAMAEFLHCLTLAALHELSVLIDG